MGIVGNSLKEGLQGVKDNKEIIQLRQKLRETQEQLSIAKANGGHTSKLEGEMEDLTHDLGSQTGIHKVPISQIDRDESQPRTVFSKSTVQERIESLRRFGQQTPIVLIPLDNGRYKLFDGELRYRSAEKLDWEFLDAVFIPIDELPEQSQVFERQVITSIHSQKLHDLDLAHALVRFLVHRHENFHGLEDRIPTILNTTIRRLERTGELENLGEIRLSTPEEQKEWLESRSFREFHEKEMFEVLLELQLNPLSINSNVFPLLKLSSDLSNAIRVDGLESSKAREINKISAEKLGIENSKVKKLRSDLIAQVIKENLALTKTKVLVNEILQKYSKVKAPRKNHKHIKTVSSLAVSDIQDLSTLKALKKALNEKLKEVNTAIKATNDR